MADLVHHFAFEEAKKQMALELEVLSPQLSHALKTGILAYVKYMTMISDEEIDEGPWV